MSQLPIVTLSRKRHRKENQILIDFDFNRLLIDAVKQIHGARWSATHKKWYVRNNPENLKSIFNVFKGLARVNSKALSNNVSEAKQYEKRERQLSQKNKTLLNNFYKYLKGKRLSESTINTYTFFVADFIEFNNEKEILSLTNRDVELFIETVFIKRQYAISTQRQFISAIKHFKNFFPNCKIENLELTRPKKDRRLPNVLSQEEIIDLIRFTQNLKHRAIIALLYSCGLRISELINLELKDINVDRKQLLVKSSKGRKDRYVSLAESFLPLLSNYFFTYKPSQYFVEGRSGGKYSAESIRQFIKKSAKVAGISKTVTPHTLRHSYATHLLENGVDIRYIQSLLGHARPETTMIYTHVKRKDLMEISNPLDSALNRLSKGDKTNTKVLLSRNFNQ